ncbi:MAG TPA: ankyrin repeat domain-containing protein, partial [Polyangiaceae bacterium]
AWLLTHGADVHEQEETTSGPVLAADAFPEIVALLHVRGAAQPTLLNASIAAAPNAFALALAAHPEQAKRSGVLAAAACAPWKTAANKRSIMTRLLDAGADPNDTYGGSTALQDVVRECDDGCMPLVHLLLDRGARVTGEALGAALSLDDASRPEVTDAFLERPIANGVTATALASATSATSEDVDRLVKLGVDWTWRDGEEDEALPLLAAVRRGDRDYARMLLAAGAPVDVHFKEATTALAEAIDGSDDARARIVELLVEKGANVNRRFPDGRTPLFAAAESGNIRVVNFLIAHGARVNERVLDDTALDAAEQHGNTPAARVLSAHGGVRSNSRGIY